MHASSASRRPRAFWFVIENSLLLFTGAVIALVWANTDLPSYEAFTHAAHFAVNEVGMVFFFALAAKEVFEATLPGGSLSSVRRASLPVLAAVGGMAGPTALYLFQVQGLPELTRGWAIPCATDIAFSFLIARYIFGLKHPAVPFLLLLAIADDALGMLILAVFYPQRPLRPGEAVLLAGLALVIAAALRMRRVRSFWPYVLMAGGLAWAGLLRGGLHPALALVPIIPFMPHESRDLGWYDPRELRRPDTLNRFEHAFKLPVEFVLFLFGLVNAGVPVGNAGPGTWIVLTSLLVGKPIGIGLFTVLGRALSLEMPGRLHWREVLTLGVVAGVGFTVALFFATAAFPPGPLLDQTRMGALLSLSAALVAALVGAVLRVGRFGRDETVA